MVTYTPAGPWAGPYPQSVSDNFGNQWEAYGPNQLKKPSVVISQAEDCCLYTTEVTQAVEGFDPSAFAPPGKSTGDTYLVCHPDGMSMWGCVDGAWVKQWEKREPKKCEIVDALCNSHTFRDSVPLGNNDVVLTTASIACVDKMLFICNQQIGVRSRFYGWGSGVTEYDITSETATGTILVEGSVPNICTTCATNAILNGQWQMQSPFEDNVPQGGLVQVQPLWRWNGGAYVNQANGAHGRRNSPELINHDTGWGISGQLNLPACKEDNLFEFKFTLITNTLAPGERLTYHTSNFGIFVEEFCHRNGVRA